MHLHRGLEFSVWTTAHQTGSSMKLIPGGPANGPLLVWVPMQGMGRQRDYRRETSPACSGETRFRAWAEESWVLCRTEKTQQGSDTSSSKHQPQRGLMSQEQGCLSSPAMFQPL